MVVFGSLFSLLVNLLGNTFHAVYLLIIVTTILAVVCTWVVLYTRSKSYCFLVVLTWLVYACLLGNAFLAVLILSVYYGGIAVACIYLFGKFDMKRNKWGKYVE